MFLLSICLSVCLSVFVFLCSEELKHELDKMKVDLAAANRDKDRYAGQGQAKLRKLCHNYGSRLKGRKDQFNH